MTDTAPRSTTIAANMRTLRKVKGWDLADLVKRLGKAGWNTSINTLSKIELGRRRVTIDDAYALASAFGMTIDQITNPVCARCNGVPPPGFACLDCGAMSGEAKPEPVKRKRRNLTPALLEEVASVYRAGVEAGTPATEDVADHFDIPPRTAARWVSEARKAGHLGPANGTRQGEAEAP